MTAPRKLLAAARGATAVEFALVAPVFLMFMMLLLEGGRMLWTQQTLQQIAFAAVRCSALAATACANDTATRTYAVAQRAAGTRTLTTAMVAVTPSSTGTTCAATGMRVVTITMPFQATIFHLLPAAPANVIARACFPVAPA